MTSTKRTKRIATRKTDDGYRVTGQRHTYPSFTAAFNAAWKTCADSGADLYAITPQGRCILQLTAGQIREYERQAN